ncbi:MAG: ATP-dependent RNA helicase HrpA [Opitutaceae bacterium]|nr:ATP-dependent RNA helicase HrpA [Opitutaceae bacterium]
MAEERQPDTTTTRDRSRSPARPPAEPRTWRPSYPEELPVSARRTEIIAALREHPVLIIAGDTGSGKTTQLPKMCLEAGRGRIACTQPRRVAAISLSRRVAEELGVQWGREVGCKIRFMDESSADTAVKFLTDGMLLAEVQADPMLRAYDTIVIDEAHERSLNIDFLLGHLNQLRHRRTDLKIIITSATIDTAAFSRAFDDAPVIQVSGRLYPVEVIYAPVDELLEEAGEFTHLDAVVAALERVLLESDRGDVLVFLSTERDIRETADLIESRHFGPLEIVPLFGRLAAADQQRVFAPSRRRKIVLSTNIAETSLTIPGIRFVIDTGEARISRFNNRTRTRRLPIEPISQSSANQRKGRCGRVAEGVCIRLYSEDDFKKRPEFSVPEIHRANLADVILRMKSARLGDIERFPFIDPPPPAAIAAGYALLEELGAIDAQHTLTPLGRDLARLPVDPIVGRMLLQATQERAVREVLVVAAALSIQDPRERPADAEAAADAAHRRFVHPDSDFLTLLAIWDAFHDEVEHLSQGRLRKFCRQHFLNYNRMREWRDIHAQLEEALGDLEPRRRDSPARTQPASEPGEQDMRFGGERYRAIHRALLPGLLANVARRDEGNLFRAGGDRKPLIFPGSTLFDRKARSSAPRGGDKSASRPKPNKSPDWIVAAEIVETTRLFARTCARIDVQWLLDVGAHACKVAHSEPTFTVESGRVLVRETTRLHGLEIRVRRVGYGLINPKHATEIFIREGLLNAELQLPHRFLEHNRALRDKVEVLRTRLRSGVYLDLDEAYYRFYASRLEGISSIHDLNRHIRDRIAREPDVLCLREEDLLGDLPEDFDRAAFPDRVELENFALPLRYAYKPGRDEDGVTVRLEPAQARHLQPGMLDWLVPGHLEEKIDHLLRALPKELRKQLLPIGEKSAAIAHVLRPTHATLPESLAAHLEKHYGVRTFPSDWHPEEIPPHLRVRVEVVGTQADGTKKSLAASRDLAQVRTLLAEQERAAAQRPDSAVVEAWKKACAAWERTGLETWTFDALPERVAVTETGGLTVHAYPGLRVEPTGVALRLFKTPEESRLDLAAALRRFFEHELRYELSWLDRDLKDVARLGPLAVTLAPIATLKENVGEHLRRHLCARTIAPLTREAFQKAAAAAREESKGLLFRFVDQLKTILELRHELVLAVAKPPYRDYPRDLARLIPPDFPLRTPHAQLKHLPRYLRAMQARARKAKENPLRDAERAIALTRLETRLAALEKSPRAAATAVAREEIGWLMEELRVSLFAQELGTAVPVSEKRLEARLAEIGG